MKRGQSLPKQRRNLSTPVNREAQPEQRLTKRTEPIKTSQDASSDYLTTAAKVVGTAGLALMAGALAPVVIGPTLGVVVGGAVGTGLSILHSQNQAKTKREAEFKAANSNALARLKEDINAYGRLDNVKNLTEESRTSLNDAIEKAITTHPEFSTRTLSQNELKKIAQAEVDRLLKEQKRQTEQANSRAIAQLRADGNTFGTLDNLAALRGDFTARLGDAIEKAVTSNSAFSSRTLSPEELKNIAQGEVDKLLLEQKQQTEEANSKAMESFKTRTSGFKDLNSSADLTPDSRTQFNRAIQTDLASHPEFSSRTLSRDELRLIAQRQVNKLLDEQRKNIEQANTTAITRLQKNFNEFGNLDNLGSLTPETRSKLSDALDKAISNNPEFSTRTLSPVDLKNIVQDQVNTLLQEQTKQTEAANTGAIASFKTGAKGFKDLNGSADLTEDSTAKFDSAIESALSLHPEFSTRTLSPEEIKKIAQDEVDKLLQEQKKKQAEQANTTAIARLKTNINAFGNLDNIEDLAVDALAQLDDALRQAISAHPQFSARPLTRDELKQIAQDEVDKYVAEVKNKLKSDISGGSQDDWNELTEDQQGSIVEDAYRLMNMRSGPVHDTVKQQINIQYPNTSRDSRSALINTALRARAVQEAVSKVKQLAQPIKTAKRNAKLVSDRNLLNNYIQRLNAPNDNDNVKEILTGAVQQLGFGNMQFGGEIAKAYSVEDIKRAAFRWDGMNDRVNGLQLVTNMHVPGGSQSELTWKDRGQNWEKTKNLVCRVDGVNNNIHLHTQGGWQVAKKSNPTRPNW